MKYRVASRSPLLHALRRLLRSAGAFDGPNPPHEHPAENLSRRELLKLAGGAAAMLTLSGTPKSAFSLNQPRIAIVGAGIAGLNAAYKLKQAGITAEIFESSTRLGGRILTAENVLADGITTEFGGEFIDSTHSEMLALIKEFGLETLDRKSESEKSLKSRLYHFGGQLRTESDVVDSIRPFMKRIKKDADSLPARINFRTPGNANRLDRITLSQYFSDLGITNWLKELLETAYITEFGLEPSEQSALNFITQVSTDPTSGLEIFGTSDERFRIKGGNSKIIHALATKLESSIRLSHRLEQIQPHASGYRLTFQSDSTTKEIDADLVLLAIPFSILRNLRIDVDLQDWKLKAIRELGYGTNSKIMVGFSKRIWREQGSVGEVFGDDGFQIAWDSSQLQPGTSGGLTSFSGGHQGLEAAKGSMEFQRVNLLRSLEKIFPGISEVGNGRSERYHWINNPHALGSYSVYKPGQWTSIRGAERLRSGNLFFAGEHCSTEYQGFMNGGAESGKRAAEEIIQALR